jgi:hypothetical protein
LKGSGKRSNVVPDIAMGEGLLDVLDQFYQLAVVLVVCERGHDDRVFEDRIYARHGIVNDYCVPQVDVCQKTRVFEDEPFFDANTLVPRNDCLE